jgi:lysophospholipid hydrolase
MQLNFWSFAMLFCLCAVALNYWIRFRYLNIYAQLKEPPLLKPDAQELHPDVNTTETPPAFHTYLDEFLQAVRIFGFLEKPVRCFSYPRPDMYLQAVHRFFMN